jgi:hypothetical protein
MKQATVNDGAPGAGKEEHVKRSNKSKRYVSVMGLLLAFSLALFVSFGCSSNSIKFEDQNTSGDKLDYLYDTQEEHADRSPKLLEETVSVVSETVGLLGGVLEVADDASTVFVVPVGALLRPVEISIVASEFQTPLGPVFLYECGPEGTKFKVPAKLSQRMPEGQSDASLYYFNEATGAWELQEVVKVKDGVATFNIKHFSKYGIS